MVETIKGKLTLGDGLDYEGDIVDGKPHGKGKLAYGEDYPVDIGEGGIGSGYVSGDYVYEGDFVNGKPHGKGKKTYANGKEYEGDFVNGKFHGKGKLDDGYLYEGDFVNGRLQGKGKMTYSNAVYEGDIDNGVFHGKGKMTYANGKVEEGNWEKGNFKSNFGTFLRGLFRRN
jgi:hypothetical protein